LYRLTAPVGGEGGNDAKRNVDQASEKVEREGKSAYNKIKDSIGGFFGQAKETGCDPQRRTRLWRSFPVGSIASLIAEGCRKTAFPLQVHRSHGELLYSAA
jgi:hypothetical protein